MPDGTHNAFEPGWGMAATAHFSYSEAPAVLKPASTRRKWLETQPGREGKQRERNRIESSEVLAGL